MNFCSLKRLSVISSVLVLACAGSAQGIPGQLKPGGLVPQYVTPPYTFPDGAALSAISSYTSGLNRLVDLQMQTTVTSAGGVLVKAVFSNGKILVGCYNGASVPNYGISSGQAKLIDPSTGSVVGTGSLTVISDILRLSIADSLVSGATMTMASSDYTPTAYLSSIGPEALEMFPGSILFDGLAPDMASMPNVIATNRIWPVKWDPNWAVETPGTVPKPGDITGDGRNDWDCNGDTWIAPLGDVFVDKWVADNGAPGADDDDSLVTVIGHDTNGNGKLDANEVTAIIGECQEIPGMNRTYIEEINGVFYVHHVNWDDNNRNGEIDPGEDVWHYIYNTSTGILKIYDKDGTLVYMGPPDGSNNQVPPGTPWDWWYDN